MLARPDLFTPDLDFFAISAGTVGYVADTTTSPEGIPVSGAELDFIGLVDAVQIGNLHEGPIGPIMAPQPFAGMIGPIEPPRDFTLQTIDLTFYLDGLGDAVRFFNSVEIQSVPVIPLPTSAWMGLSLLGGMGMVDVLKRKMRDRRRK